MALAEHGNAKAQYHLALMYQRGEGVKKDYQKALKWYRKAAKKELQWHRLIWGGCIKTDGVLPKTIKKQRSGITKQPNKDTTPRSGSWEKCIQTGIKRT